MIICICTAEFMKLNIDFWFENEVNDGNTDRKTKNAINIVSVVYQLV